MKRHGGAHHSKHAETDLSSNSAIKRTQEVTSIIRTIVNDSLSSPAWREFKIVVACADMVVQFAENLEGNPTKSAWFDMSNTAFKVGASEFLRGLTHLALGEFAAPFHIMEKAGGLFDTMWGDYFNHVRENLPRPNIKLNSTGNPDLDFYRELLVNEDRESFMIEYESSLPIVCINLHHFSEFIHERITLLDTHQDKSQETKNPSFKIQDSSNIVFHYNQSCVSISSSHLDPMMQIQPHYNQTLFSNNLYSGTSFNYPPQTLTENLAIVSPTNQNSSNILDKKIPKTLSQPPSNSNTPNNELPHHSYTIPTKPFTPPPPPK